MKNISNPYEREHALEKRYRDLKEALIQHRIQSAEPPGAPSRTALLNEETMMSELISVKRKLIATRKNIILASGMITIESAPFLLAAGNELFPLAQHSSEREIYLHLLDALSSPTFKSVTRMMRYLSDYHFIHGSR